MRFGFMLESEPIAIGAKSAARGLLPHLTSNLKNRLRALGGGWSRKSRMPVVTSIGATQRFPSTVGIDLGNLHLNVANYQAVRLSE